MSSSDLSGYSYISVKTALNSFVYCAVPENIHTPPDRRDWNFLGGGGFCKTKNFKEV